MKERGRLYVLLVAVVLSVASVVAQQRRTLIDADWEFAQEGQPVVNVNLPHDWSIQGVPSVDEPAASAVIEIGDFHNPSKERTKPLTSFHLSPSAKVQ